MTFGATLKADKKTSKIADLFVSEALLPQISQNTQIIMSVSSRLRNLPGLIPPQLAAGRFIY